MARGLARALFLVLALVSADFAEPLLPPLARASIADDSIGVEDDAVLVHRNRLFRKPAASRPERARPVRAAVSARPAPPRPVATSTVEWLLPFDRRPVLPDPVTTTEDH